MSFIKKLIWKKIYQKIKQYDEIVIARHINPDPDAVASQMALRNSIRLTFPKKKVFSVGLGVARFKCYGLIDKVDFNELSHPLLIVLDVPNIIRVDGIENLNYKEIIKIDHHPAEDIKGNIDWTEEKSSSASQMVTELILNTKLKLDEQIANNLFLGIVSDSERFVLKNTTLDTLKTTYDLLRISKINFPDLYDILYLRPLNEIKFQAYITDNLVVTENNLGYINIEPQIFPEYNVDQATATNLINNFNFIKEVIVWFFVTYEEKSNQYKVSIRSRGPVINQIASKYHGGGHKFASGCRLMEKEEIDLLVKDLDNLCKEYQELNKV